MHKVNAHQMILLYFTRTYFLPRRQHTIAEVLVAFISVQCLIVFLYSIGILESILGLVATLIHLVIFLVVFLFRVFLLRVLVLVLVLILFIILHLVLRLSVIVLSICSGGGSRSSSSSTNANTSGGRWVDALLLGARGCIVCGGGTGC